MIVWSLQRRSINLGRPETHSCANCGSQRPFSVLFHYRCFRLYWLFGVVTSKRYVKQCAFCGAAWQVDPKNVAARFPIPFMQRFGLVTLVTAVIVAIVAGAAR